MARPPLCSKRRRAFDQASGLLVIDHAGPHREKGRQAADGAALLFDVVVVIVQAADAVPHQLVHGLFAQVGGIVPAGGGALVVKNPGGPGKIGFIFVQQGVQIDRQEIQRPAVKARRHIPAAFGLGQIVQVIDIVVAAQALVDLAFVGLFDAHPDGLVLLLGHCHGFFEPGLVQVIVSGRRQR